MTTDRDIPRRRRFRLGALPGPGLLAEKTRHPPEKRKGWGAGWLRTVACLALLGLWADPAAAILLEKPLDCQPGLDCFVQNYVDLAPGPEFADWQCGHLSYDKHKGTDFRIPFDRIAAGVPVRAAADGVVGGVRDGMDDISVHAIGKDAVKNRECGNGVVLMHPGGVQTQYCHLRKGSLRVKVGELIKAGQELGLVGLSGETEFPHLHFEVRIDGKAVDPFTGKTMETGCGAPNAHPLWSPQAQAAMPYVATGGLDAGFADAQPDIATLFVGGKKAQALSSQSPQMLFWAAFWGVRKGDVITMRITSPNGEDWTAPPHVIAQDQAQVLVGLGRKRVAPWPAGTYKGKAVLVRQGNGGKSVVIPMARTLVIPAGS